MANLQASLKAFANKISGTSVVDNTTNPNSAYSKMKASVRTPAPQKALSMAKSTLPKNQQVFGVPGVSQKSQLPVNYQ